jgi:hypothetical protein
MLDITSETETEAVQVNSISAECSVMCFEMMLIGSTVLLEFVIIVKTRTRHSRRSTDFSNNSHKQQYYILQPERQTLTSARRLHSPNFKRHCNVPKAEVSAYYFASLPVVLQMPLPKNNKQTPWPESASELYRPSDRRLSAK